jgi:hypothetical protein
MKFSLWAINLLVFTALACNTSALPFLTTPVPPEPISSATATFSLITPATEMPTGTATVPVDPVCVPQGLHDPLPATSFEEYPNAFLLFLNTGGAPSALQANMENLSIANSDSSVSVADLTGDKKNDVVVSFLEPDPQTVPPPGALLVYICRGDQYTLAHIELSDNFLSAPRILRLQDLNADGSADLLFSSTTCGAHTCFESTQILAWNGVDFEPRLDGGTDDLPSPDLQITDYDRDGVYDIEMTAGGFSSVGAGPQRSLTRIWEYNPGSGLWEPSQQILGTSDYRIHILHDADAASRNGEYQVALVLYDQVINNPDLLDWMEKEEEKLNIGAYARYKLVVVYALQGNLERAQSFLDEIDSVYSVNIPQRVYIDMAIEFLIAYEQGGQEAGCLAAHQFAALNAGQVLSPLGSLTFGYANPDYTPLDVCP